MIRTAAIAIARSRVASVHGRVFAPARALTPATAT
jgi:hypothetical protein